MKKTKMLGIVSAMAMAASVVPAAAFAEDSSFSGYVLMNVPYSAFYGADAADICDVDAVSSATNKTGNYGKTGGAYHSGTTAGTDAEGNAVATGKDTNSKVQGVTWAVKADSLDAVKALGGTEITADSTVTTATLGRGQTSTSTLQGYQALTEAPAYSYYVLDSEPENYLVLDGTSFTTGKTSAVNGGNIEVPVSYGTNWGDIQIDIAAAENASDKIVNAMVITAEDGTSKGLYHLDQIWSYSDIAWKVASTPGLDGKKLTNVRFYCSAKDTDLTDGEVPAYENYVYDYAFSTDVAEVYTGAVTASFKGNSLVLSGLPEDGENIKVKVYHTTGGRNPVLTYITPVFVDPADDDIDPEFVSLENNAVSIVKGSVTNKAGTTVEYGELVDETTYTVEFSCDNYIIKKIMVDYVAEEANVPGGSTEAPATTAAPAPAATTKAGNGTSSSSKTTTAAKTTAAAKSNDSNSPKTGDAGAAIPVAFAAMAGAAAVISKRRKK
ncbi:MAG: NPXTG-anchored protein [Alistipes sp.]|nr:NPXTG-anchored protein [Alistipes sp.]